MQEDAGSLDSLPTLSDASLLEGFREDAASFPHQMQMYQLAATLGSKSYASSVIASKSHGTLIIGNITIEYHSHTQRFRIRLYEHSRKVFEHNCSNSIEAEMLIDALVIRDHMHF
ncbi:MAG TPA: hypothetical protein VGE64_06425 [Xanthomonadaceae bacterium]